MELKKNDMKIALKTAKPLTWYKKGAEVIVDNKMQSGYSYILSFDAGKSLKNGGMHAGAKISYPDFKPKYSPQQMLQMGVFEGKYCNDQISEFPREWYLKDGELNEYKFSPDKPDVECNYFKIKSRLSLQEWRLRKWIPCAPGDNDMRGWFEWYCRYWLGRRQPEVDMVQIKRWKAFVRHYAQFLKNTKNKKDHFKRRQGLLQWSYPCKDS